MHLAGGQTSLTHALTSIGRSLVVEYLMDLMSITLGLIASDLPKKNSWERLNI
jgi:hypothetical protein